MRYNRIFLLFFTLVLLFCGCQTAKAAEEISKKDTISKLTFPHQLLRVILHETIYRSLSIINNTQYHKQPQYTQSNSSVTQNMWHLPTDKDLIYFYMSSPFSIEICSPILCCRLLRKFRANKQSIRQDKKAMAIKKSARFFRCSIMLYLSFQIGFGWA